VRVLVTGGAGFIGSHLVQHLLRERADTQIVTLDLLTYAGDLRNLRDVVADPRHTFVAGDICDTELVWGLLDRVDVVLNLAAESHVDRSIQDSAPFIRTNVQGTRVLLDVALDRGVSRFLQVSTDEVYGELPWLNPSDTEQPRGGFTEEDPIRPRSPYAASKAAGDLLVQAYASTYGLEAVIARGSNNYGPRQHREKLIPHMIHCALTGAPLPLYGDGLHIRDWMHVEDFCRGILATLERGEPGHIYNFGGGSERTNLTMAQDILGRLETPLDAISFVEDRPGHDRRYAVDFSKARDQLGWEPQETLAGRLGETIEWYRKRWTDEGRRSS
jgi:dTDP-glucose 4,6-dehydratase